MKKSLIVETISIYEAIVQTDEMGNVIKSFQGKFIHRIIAKRPKKFTTKRDLELFRSRIKSFSKHRLGKPVFVVFLDLKTLDEHEPDGWVAKHTLMDNGKVKVIDSKYNEKTYSVVVKTDEKTKKVTKVIELQDDK